METLNQYTLDSVAKILDSQVSDSATTRFNSVSTDSRNIGAGDLFVALKGPSFDGHEYLQQVFEKGAVGAVVSEPRELTLSQIKVDDTRIALGKMARARRNAFKNKVIGLTGSNGKTTVKELISTILSAEGKVLATRGNFNNDIGLPLTLLRLENNEDFAVIEMGANHHGEIDYLTDIARPDIALITNAGSAHLEGFGSVEGVATAKGEIFNGLSQNGIAVINRDDAYAPYWLSRTEKFKQLCFGLKSPKADVRAENIVSKSEGMQFELHIPNDAITITLPLSGKHNVANALAAATVAYALDLDLSLIKTALESIEPVKGRLNFLNGQNGSLIIDDTYNANVDSVKAGIDVLVSQGRTSTLVIGDLFESGDNAESMHAEIGQYAREKGVSSLYGLGDMSGNAVEAFGQNAFHFLEKAELVKELTTQLNKNMCVLVKGSRGMRMEEIVEKLK